MPLLNNVAYYAIHPNELRSILQWSIWHTPVHSRDEESEPASLTACFDLLDKTSRSFSAVIQELNHKLLVPICLFYVILRGLDTIEDDMTIQPKDKIPLLRDFHNKLEQDGWTFNGSGPNEKDRIVLVHFHYIVTEFKKLGEPYRVIIKDITKKMGNGMADFVEKYEVREETVETTEEYELYCHYVAGVVGEGLTRLFVESGSANPALLDRPDLYESMGQLLQQTNVIRDIAEDARDGRRFWPKEVWSKYVDNFEDLFKPQNKEIALRCSSEMILIAIQRSTDCLYYLAGIREQSVFNFAAIPQAMAIATLELCFRNPAMFQKNIKISKGQACRLMIRSSQNLQILYGVFKEYSRKIHKKNNPMDPNFLKVSVACGKVEQFIENVFPTQDRNAIANGGAKQVAQANGAQPQLTVEEQQKKAAEEKEARRDVMIMGLAVFGFMMVIAAIMFFIAWLFGARFDLAFESLKEGNIFTPGDTQLKKARGEL